MFCNSCGKPIIEASTFCTHCGTAVLPAKNFDDLDSIVTKLLDQPEPLPFAFDKPLAPQQTKVESPIFDFQPATPVPQFSPQAPISTFREFDAPVPMLDIPQVQSNTVHIPKNILPLSVGQCFLFGLVMLVPILNIILSIVWSFSAKANLNRRNMARAALIAFSVLLFAVVLFLCGSIFYLLNQ